eukprot:m.181504 g.181504  ORF g.181504 m.181504 type:complete len:340 (-) comp32069_c2_seq1:3317-4336(-)
MCVCHQDNTHRTVHAQIHIHTHTYICIYIHHARAHTHTTTTNHHHPHPNHHQKTITTKTPASDHALKPRCGWFFNTILVRLELEILQLENQWRRRDIVAVVVFKRKHETIVKAVSRNVDGVRQARVRICACCQLFEEGHPLLREVFLRASHHATPQRARTILNTRWILFIFFNLDFHRRSKNRRDCQLLFLEEFVASSSKLSQRHVRRVFNPKFVVLSVWVWMCLNPLSETKHQLGVLVLRLEHALVVVGVGKLRGVWGVDFNVILDLFRWIRLKQEVVVGANVVIAVSELVERFVLQQLQHFKHDQTRDGCSRCGNRGDDATSNHLALVSWCLRNRII